MPVGAPAWSTARLQPYENVWRYTATLANGDVKVQGLWSDRMDLVDRDGRKVMRRVQGMTYVNGLTSSTINIFDPVTLAAVFSETHKLDGSWIKRAFDGTTVTETLGASPADKVGTTTVISMPEPVFDFWGGMYGTLIAALPLKVGMHGTIPSIAEFSPDYQPATFDVVREEDLRAGALGVVHTFVVQTEGMTFWLSASAPYVLKLEAPMAAPPGTAASWTEL